MKRFMYLSVAMLCLALTLLIGFHIGTRSVQAQAPEPITGYVVSQPSTQVSHYVMLSNGDVYRQIHDQSVGAVFGTPTPRFLGNFWGGTVPVSERTWGSTKDAYKK